MTHLEHISDPGDHRIADYVDLRDPALRRGVEAAAGFFVAESPHVIETVCARPALRSALVTPKRLTELEPILEPLGVPVYVAEPAVLRRAVGFDLHRGAVAAVDRWPLPPLAPCSPGARASRSANG
jgi:tRNA G18 (ribose-2'-O)-methylase SpoU